MNNEKNKNNQNNVVSGVAFDDLTVAEMAEVQGAGDMEHLYVWRFLQHMRPSILRKPLKENVKYQYMIKK